MIPSQANYIMVQIIDKFSAKDLTKLLLIKYNILIKDLTSKVSSEFVRIAVRNTVENNKLIAALHEEFK